MKIWWHEKAPGERLREDRRRAAWQAFPPFCQTDVFIGNTDALPEDTLAIPDTMHRTLIPDYCICRRFCLMLLIFLCQNIISAGCFHKFYLSFTLFQGVLMDIYD